MDIVKESFYQTPVSNSPLLPLLLLSLATQKHSPNPSYNFKSEYDYIVGTMDIVKESSYQTPVSNSPLLPLLLLSLATQKHSPNPSYNFKSEYDYIVVGAGAAGSVVASRLSECPCVTVLLLEAGGTPPLLSEVPSLGRYLKGSDIDWKYETTPQLHIGAGYPNRQLPFAGGKMLGGSSSLNSMLYVRANLKNYDDWEYQGAKGWSARDVYPYFLKLEDNRDPDFAWNGYHTYGGPITVEQPRYEPVLKKAVQEAVRSLGYQILDSNAARQTGFYDQQGNLRNNQRCSTAKAYLVPAENRTNLDIVANAFVTKIVIANGVATGVQFDYLGLSYRIKARREVILSAGGINTPQILKLSGVGPQEELNRFNIPVVTHLPGVGNNLQNHPGISYSFLLHPSIPSFDEKISNPENIDEYIRKRSGPLSSTDGFVFLSFLKGFQIVPVEDFPNYELYFTEMPISLIKRSGLKDAVFQQIFGPYVNRAIFTCTITLLHPYSKGTITLQSANPYNPPLLDPNYLSDPRDVEDMLQGLKNCKRIIGTAPLRGIGASALQTVVPGCEEFYGDDDKYFRCHLRTLTHTFHHPSGTAKMGNVADPTTVVDPKLRVKNIRNLRVVDASVMPSVTSGNTHIPTIMIAEKASDMIKETINCFENRCQENIYLPPSYQEPFAFGPFERFQFSNMQAGK